MPAIQSGAATIAGLSRQRPSAGSRRAPGPSVGKTGAKPEIWQNPQDFAAKLHGFQAAAQAFNAAARSGDMTAIKARYADLGGTCKACHDNYRVGDAPLTGKQPVWDLPVRLVHWLLAGADRVQLVVGEEPPYRLAHLVGDRDPDAADLPPAVGLRRQLDRALGRASFAARAPCSATCAAGGAGSAIRRSARSASSRCSLAVAVQVGLGLISEDEDGLYTGPLAALVSIDTSDTARDIHELWFYVILGLVVLHLAAILFYRLRGQDLTWPMITGRARAAPGTTADATRQMVGRADLPRRRARHQPLGGRRCPPLP